MATPTPPFTLPPTPSTGGHSLKDFQQNVAVWTRKAQQALRAVAETGGVPGPPGPPGPGSDITAMAPLVLSILDVLSIPQATTSVSGYLDSADWNTFNTGAAEAAAALPAASFAAAFSAAFASETTTNLAEGTNLYYTAARFTAAFAAETTTNLAEGTNLYYTAARFAAAFAAETTTNLAEGTNLYYTAARFAAAFASAFAAETTDNLAQGVTNLYFTAALARAAVSATSPIGYNSSTGVFSIPQATGSINGYLLDTDWTTFNTGATLAAAALPKTKQTKSVVLCAAYTPTATGADTAEIEMPYDTNNGSLTFNILRVLFRVQSGGGAPSIQVELYAGTGAFSPTTVGVVTLASGANEGQITSGFTTATIASGSKLRFNVLTLATATAWTIQVDIAAQ